ncbi:MAG: hypothetical protein IKV44_01250, partial [Clostridia bacterium]|nr:hypothetical protein [Clostridia bacterium]
MKKSKLLYGFCSIILSAVLMLTVFTSPSFSDTSFADVKVEGVAVATQNDFVNAIANGDDLITLTGNITLSGTGEISTVANTTIQSKTGEQFTITLDGNCVGTVRYSNYNSQARLVLDITEKTQAFVMSSERGIMIRAQKSN